MELIKVIRSNYGINPFHVEQVTDNVYQIEDHYGQYSFKKSSLTQKQLEKWRHVYHQAFENNIVEILPIYLTNDSDFCINFNQQMYYLSPWINSEEIHTEHIYECIGRIHAKTKSIQTIQIEEFKQQSFINYKNVCLNRQKRLLSYVETFEQERYMSPFGLQVCTHFRDLEIVFKKVIASLDNIIDKREPIEWSNSLCHGQFSCSHILKEKQTYIINWEKASYMNATTDLIHFFKEEIKFYDSPEEDFLNLFPKYLKQNKLNMDELMILSIYLLNPLNYINVIEQYMNQANSKSTIHMVQTLEHLYRQLLFGLKMTKLIESEDMNNQVHEND